MLGLINQETILWVSYRNVILMLSTFEDPMRIVVCLLWESINQKVWKNKWLFCANYFVAYCGSFVCAIHVLILNIDISWGLWHSFPSPFGICWVLHLRERFAEDFGVSICMICSIDILILYYLSSCIILLGRAMRVDFQFMCMPLRRNLYMWAVTLSTKMSTVIRSLNTSILVSLIGSFCSLQCVLVCLTLPKFFAFTFVYISKALWVQ